MRHGRRALATSGVAVATMALMAVGGVAPASAATPIGRAATNGVQCNGSGSDVQVSTGSGVPSYGVPAGVTEITQWSTQAGAAGGSMALEIWRATTTAGTYSLVGISPLETLTANKLNTFNLTSPIGVRTGDRLGEFDIAADCQATATGPAGDLIGTTVAGAGEPQVGDRVGFSGLPNTEDNISAVGTSGQNAQGNDNSGGNQNQPV